MADYNWLFNDPLIGHRLIQLDAGKGKSYDKPDKGQLASVKPYSLPPKKQIVDALKAIAEAEKVARFSDELPQIWITPQWIEDMEKHSEHKREFERKQFLGMTQRKPSDERIESKADRSAHIKTGDTPEEFEPYKAGFIHGTTWYRDNHDPWFYIEDGELPELGDPDSMGFKKSEEVFLKVCEDQEYGTGWLVEYGDNNYYWDLVGDHEIRSKVRDNCELKDVHCWQPIIKPQK